MGCLFLVLTHPSRLYPTWVKTDKSLRLPTHLAFPPTFVLLCSGLTLKAREHDFRMC